MRKLSTIDESFWGDVHKRSIGNEVRKEDDINLLDKDGLYEYLISHYKPVEGRDIKNYISCGNHYIHLCIFIYRDVKYSICLDIFNCRVKVRTPYIKRWPANLLDMIYKKYNREDVIDKNRDHMTFITPKEGKGNNQFYIDFLDMILNNVDKPLLNKVINESFWGDVHKRSIGDEVRKEDDVNFLDFDGFFDYLKNRYRVLSKFKIHIDLYKSRISVPLISNSEKAPWCINLEFEINKKKENHIVTPELMNENFPDICSKLEEQFNVEHNNNGYIYILPKDNGQITNRFFVEILDFVIDNCGNEDEFILIERKK